MAGALSSAPGLLFSRLNPNGHGGWRAISCDAKRDAMNSLAQPVVFELLVQAFARDAEGLGGLALVVVVLFERFEQDPLLDLLHHFLERAFARMDLVENVLDLADARAQMLGL